MHIYGVHIDRALDEAAFQEMMQYVAPEKRAGIRRFRKPMDAIRSLLGDLIIRTILCKHYGFYNNEIRYAYREFGKPYLPQHPGIHFNISHSGDRVVGVVSTDSVGIDIEKITEIKRDLASLALTDEEFQKLRTGNEAERIALFFELWTLKESYVKATGKGLSEGLNTLKVLKQNGTISIEKDEKPVPAYFALPDCIEGYKISLCSSTPILYRDIQLFTLNEFRDEAKEVLIF